MGSERHFAMLETAIRASCKTKILGWLPREPKIAIPERHLGLHGAIEQSSAEDGDSAAMQIDVLAALAEEHLDLDELLALECGLEFSGVERIASAESKEKVRIGVACDHAFSFYYEDNLDLLREHGAEIVRFSPIHDKRLPDGLDALYLGGGYPELYAEELSRNRRCSMQSNHSLLREGPSMRSAVGCFICRTASAIPRAQFIRWQACCIFPWR